jgi:hypothetical protein
MPANQGSGPRRVLSPQVRFANTSEITAVLEETARMCRESIALHRPKNDPQGHKLRAWLNSEGNPCRDDLADWEGHKERPARLFREYWMLWRRPLTGGGRQDLMTRTG